jgi:hypothetical protein
MFFALSFEQIAMYLCTPAIGTRWSQWGGMAASFCHFVMPVIVWYIVSDRSNGYDNTHSCCFGLTRTYTASVWLSYMSLSNHIDISLETTSFNELIVIAIATILLQ